MTGAASLFIQGIHPGHPIQGIHPGHPSRASISSGCQETAATADAGLVAVAAIAAAWSAGTLAGAGSAAATLAATSANFGPVSDKSLAGAARDTRWSLEPANFLTSFRSIFLGVLGRRAPDGTRTRILRRPRPALLGNPPLQPSTTARPLTAMPWVTVNFFAKVSEFSAEAASCQLSYRRKRIPQTIRQSGQSSFSIIIQGATVGQVRCGIRESASADVEVRFLKVDNACQPGHAACGGRPPRHLPRIRPRHRDLVGRGCFGQAATDLMNASDGRCINAVLRRLW